MMPSRRAAPKKASKSALKGKVMPFQKKAESQQEPKPPYPAQHQPHPGIEAEIEPRPHYKAPLYQGSRKLWDK
jgi:hypothetical protein